MATAGLPEGAVLITDEESVATPTSTGSVPTAGLPEGAVMITEEESATPVVEPEQIGYGQSLLQGAGEGITLGYKDEMLAGVMSPLAHLLGDSPKGESVKDTYFKMRDALRERDLAAKEANPMMYGAGEIGGVVGTAPLALLKAPVAATAMGKVAQGVGTGAALGATYGAGQAEEMEDIPEGAMTGAAYGAAGGAAGPVVQKTAQLAGKGVARLGKKLEKFSVKRKDAIVKEMENILGQGWADPKKRMTVSRGDVSKAMDKAIKRVSKLSKKDVNLLTLENAMAGLVGYSTMGPFGAVLAPMIMAPAKRALMSKANREISKDIFHHSSKANRVEGLFTGLQNMGGGLMNASKSGLVPAATTASGLAASDQITEEEIQALLDEQFGSQ